MAPSAAPAASYPEFLSSCRCSVGSTAATTTATSRPPTRCWPSTRAVAPFRDPGVWCDPDQLPKFRLPVRYIEPSKCQKLSKRRVEVVLIVFFVLNSYSELRFLCSKRIYWCLWSDREKRRSVLNSARKTPNKSINLIADSFKKFEIFD